METRTRYFAARVLENRDLGGGQSWLHLDGCGPLAGARPGQFAMLRGEWGRDPILPRAYSVLAVDEGVAQFLVRRVGRGSALLAGAERGAEVSVLGPLGTCFPDAEAGIDDVLVAGGCGLPPIHLRARRAAALGYADRTEVLCGARRAAELPRPLLDALEALGLPPRVSTDDGSAGHAGLVTELLERRLGLGGSVRVLACGPRAMLRATRELCRAHGARCYLSLEAEMACGLGLCLGCAVEGREQRYLHVCTDGPVFEGEAVWP